MVLGLNRFISSGHQMGHGRVCRGMVMVVGCWWRHNTWGMGRIKDASVMPHKLLLKVLKVGKRSHSGVPTEGADGPRRKMAI